LATVLLAAFWVSAGVGMASPATALRDYQSGNFTNALAEYTKIAAVKTNDLRLVFNAGDAAYRATNFDLAENLFQQVTLSPNLKLQQQAFYNLGNVQYRMSLLKFEPSDEGLNAIAETWTNAFKSYARAVQLDTNDVDAADNLIFVKKQIDQITRLREAIRLAKEDANEAVRRAEFHHALEIMEKLNHPLAAKTVEEFTKKLKDIDDIATPPR
jgi:tetratricopeptide (TPR) repeat protein